MLTPSMQVPCTFTNQTKEVRLIRSIHASHFSPAHRSRHISLPLPQIAVRLPVPILPPCSTNQLTQFPKSIKSAHLSDQVPNLVFCPILIVRAVLSVVEHFRSDPIEPVTRSWLIIKSNLNTGIGRPVGPDRQLKFCVP